jgi:hypothetical protein
MSYANNSQVIEILATPGKTKIDDSEWIEVVILINSYTTIVDVICHYEHT